MPEGTYHQALCKNCGLLFVQSSADDNRLQAMYNNEYVDLKLTDELILDNLAEKESLIRLKYRKIRSLTQSGESKKWLDIGSQFGGLLELAQNDGYEVFGIDMCDEYCHFTSKRLNLPVGRMFSEDLVKIDLEDDYFDVISMFETLEHIVDYKPILEKINRILRPGGLLFISVPIADFQRLRIFAKKHLKFKVGGKQLSNSQLLIHTHIYNFSLKSLRYLSNDFGFSHVKAIPIGFFVSYPSTSTINKLWGLMAQLFFIEKLNFTMANDILVVWKRN